MTQQVHTVSALSNKEKESWIHQIKIGSSVIQLYYYITSYRTVSTCQRDKIFYEEIIKCMITIIIVEEFSGSKNVKKFCIWEV